MADTEDRKGYWSGANAPQITSDHPTHPDYKHFPGATGLLLCERWGAVHEASWDSLRENGRAH